MWFWILITIILIFTSLFAIVLSNQSLEEIKANWKNQRCNVNAILLAALLKPDDDPRSPMEYAQANFQFCMENNAKSILKTAFGPLYTVMESFMNILGVTTGVLNNVRTMFGGLVQKFNALLSARYTQYKQIQYEAAKGWYKLQSAMNRVSGVLTGFLWMGVSSIIGLLNLKDYVTKIVLIVIGILMAMVLFLFLFMAPVLPVIIVTIGVLAGAGIEMGGAAGAFCVEPRAVIRMADGTTKYNHDIRVGDKLYNDDPNRPNTVTGLLYANGADHPMVEIGGVCMSDSHRVEHNGVMILARDHPEARSSDKTFERIICLNTTTHRVPVLAADKIMWVSDWQEIDKQDDHYWIRAVYNILNPTHSMKPMYYPQDPPLIHESVQVHKKDRGWTSACRIHIGDIIEDNEGSWTTVLAKYYGVYHEKDGIYETTEKDSDSSVKATTNGISDPLKGMASPLQGFSDGVWVHQRGGWHYMYDHHISANTTSSLQYGVFFVTASGSFLIKHNGSTHCVRDFTECGIQNIEKTYDMLDVLLAKKAMS